MSAYFVEAAEAIEEPTSPDRDEIRSVLDEMMREIGEVSPEDERWAQSALDMTATDQDPQQ